MDPSWLDAESYADDLVDLIDERAMRYLREALANALCCPTVPDSRLRHTLKLRPSGYRGVLRGQGG